MELKKEEECESYTVRDLLVTNTRVGVWLHPAGELWVLLTLAAVALDDVHAALGVLLQVLYLPSGFFSPIHQLPVIHFTVLPSHNSGSFC